MLKPNENVIRALINLEGNISWNEIVAWIDKSLLTQSIANNKLTGEATIKGQGRNLELEDLLTHIRKCREYELNAKETKRMENKGG